MKNRFKTWEIRLSETSLVMTTALFSVALHLAALSNFGYFRDELYYIACSDHLDFGYVDHPPLSLLFLKLVRILFGDSLPALRIWPALGAGVLVILTARMARELGGGKFSVVLAGLAGLAPIGNGFLFHVYSMNFWDILFWQALILVLIRVIKTGNPRYWPLFGLLAGLGAMNKISVLFLVFGIVAGLLLTRHREALKSFHFWSGAGIAVLIFLPHILWNAAHDWPTLEFMRNAKAFKMASVAPLQFFLGQVLYQNPVLAPLWLAGLGYFFFHREGRRFRTLGWMFLAIFLVFTWQEAKDYYLSGGYPVLIAGGSVPVGNWIERRGWKSLMPVTAVLILVPTLILIPLALPILSVDRTISHIRRVGVQGQPGENHELGALPQHFADMLGWEEFAAAAAEAFGKLTPEERESCVFYVRNYGEAGAIDFFGPRLGLPGAICAHNNYWLWGPGERMPDVVIVLGWSHDPDENFTDLRSRFEEVELGSEFECTYCMPYENGRQFYICRKMDGSLRDIWEHEKHFG